MKISLPDELANGEILVQDDGIGMTARECQDRYLYVGQNRRGADPTARSAAKNRHVLGRKGIGKFAGFGIARVMRVTTVSAKTGERTVFELRLDALMGQDYIGPGSKKIRVLQYDPPDEDRKIDHGTSINLYELKLARKVRSDFQRAWQGGF